MNPKFVARVQDDPKFKDLVAKRMRLASVLTVLMLIIYLGFIFVIAFAPKILAIPLGGVTTLGIPVGIFVIASAFVLTWVYVHRANTEFDTLAKSIAGQVESR
jgi:uncharacterized membrane protein (DUF485 family)